MARASPFRRHPSSGSRIGSERAWYFFLLPFALGVLLLNLNWLRSAYGRAWMAIRHRDIAAESLGINVALYKLLAFSASTSLTCVAGALWAYHTGFVSVEAFDFDMLIQYLAMVIIGGLGSVLGACLGAVFVVVLPHLISIVAAKLPFLQGLGGKSFELQVGVFGVVMLLFLVLEPRGLAGIWARMRFYFQLWPFRYRAWEVLTMLEVENLEVVYSRVIVAVQGVSLKVPDNSIVALLGTNGAGKSTTVRAISGFLPVDDADIRKGTIRFAGQSILGLPPYDVARRGVVLVPERRKIFETLTVEENLRIAPHSGTAAAVSRRHRTAVRNIPGSGRAQEADVGLSERRRAADAGDIARRCFAIRSS